MAEDVSITHFTGAGFLASGVVAAMEVGDFVTALIEGGDDVSGGGLL